MKVVKVILMVFGAVALLSLVSCAGAAGWLLSAPAEHMTAADIEVGGKYSDADRAALKAACTKSMKKAASKETESICACIASSAGTGVSRFERILLQSTFEGDVRRIVSVSTALAKVNIEPERFQQVAEDSKERMTSLMTSCGAKQFAATGP